MIRETAKRLDFPQEAIDCLGECFDDIVVLEDGNEQLALAMDAFYANKDYNTILDGLAEKSKHHRYEVDMVFLLLCVDPTHEIYYIKELPDDLFWHTMEDLKVKLMECKAWHNIWGTVFLEWLRGYFVLERYGLGRLQYDTIEFPYDDYKGIIKKGDMVCSCHIPSSGPLLKEEVLESFKEAYVFFKDEVKDGILPIVCHSWLLYPPHYEVFPENSNLRKFYDLFDIIDSRTRSREEMRRVFHINETDDIASLPENTSLQKRFKQFFLEGNVMGDGFGVILFDGEKIL